MTDLDLYWTIQAFTAILRDADTAHHNYIAELPLTDDQWEAAHERWEREHVPAYYAYDPSRVAATANS